MAVEDAYELAYREAVRALDRQLAAVNELRGRASMLLATASISVSLLGHESFRGMRPFAWAAIVCFALLSVCVLAIVWPRSDWGVDIDPDVLLDAGLSIAEADAGELKLDLIAHMTDHREANAGRFAQISLVFRLGACLLATQLVLTIGAASAIV